MESRGASAICTRKMRSPGMDSIGGTGEPRENKWNVSSTRPMLGCSALRTISQASR